jgi:hypothetical protein
VDPDDTGAALVLIEDEDEGEEDALAELPILVWPENWESVDLYMFLQTQWLTAGMDASRVGLDYKAAHAVLDGRRVLDHEPYMRDLQIMELAAIEVFTEQAQRRLARLRRDADRRARR